MNPLKTIKFCNLVRIVIDMLVGKSEQINSELEHAYVNLDSFPMLKLFIYEINIKTVIT